MPRFLVSRGQAVVVTGAFLVVGETNGELSFAAAVDPEILRS